MRDDVQLVSRAFRIALHNSDRKCSEDEDISGHLLQASLAAGLLRANLLGAEEVVKRATQRRTYVGSDVSSR